VTAGEIINEIKHLPPGEQAEVARYVRTLDAERRLTPKELGELAGKLANENDPAKAQTLKEEIASGFYGTKRDA